MNATISNTNKLHFYYPIDALQTAVEDITANLGKRRASEKAPHLLDLIAMTKDEASLFKRYAKEAMSKVFDVLNGSAYDTTKQCEWKDEFREVTPIPKIKGTKASFDCEVNNAGCIVINGNLSVNTDTQIDITKFDLEYTIRLRCELESIVLETGAKFLENKEFDVLLDANTLTQVSPHYFIVENLMVSPPLEGATEMLSEQRIVNAQYVDGAIAIQEKNPTFLKDGEIVKVGDSVYMILVDRYLSGLDLNKDAVKFESTEATIGIHYYFEKPTNLNYSVIQVLDEAIEQALINRIIWKWLSIAYPNEAPTYDIFYKESINEVRIRSNQAFYKQYNLTPRIL